MSDDKEQRTRLVFGQDTAPDYGIDYEPVTHISFGPIQVGGFEGKISTLISTPAGLVMFAEREGYSGDDYLVSDMLQYAAQECLIGEGDEIE